MNSTDFFHLMLYKTSGLAGDEVLRCLCESAKDNIPFFEMCWIARSDFLYDRVIVLSSKEKENRRVIPDSYMLLDQACEKVYKSAQFQMLNIKPNEKIKILNSSDIGYYYGFPIVDMKGLVIAHFALVTSQKIDVNESDESRVFFRKLRLEIERFEDDVREVEIKHKLQAVLNSTMDGIITFDEDYRILLFNDSAERILKSEPGKIIGHSFKRFLTSEFRQSCDEYMIKCLRSKQLLQSLDCVKKRVKVRTNNFQEVEIEANFSCAVYKNKMYFTVVIRDLTQQNLLNHQIVQLKEEKTKLITEIKSFYNRDVVIGKSSAIEAALDEARKVSQTNSTVLLTGETGTGKELFAATIHNASKRSQNIFIKVNCAALPDTLIESELFGHEKGAFTGASSMRKGRFELADGGTVFLDEIGELNKDVQSKLLRVLQEREFERVGGSETIHVNVRIIAATHQNLLAKVQDGSFREDLFFRLNIFPINIPPLRERLEDIPLLSKYLLDKIALNVGKNVRYISEDALLLLTRYHWPGNIRELANVMERAIILCEDEIINPRHIFLTHHKKNENCIELTDMEIRHIRMILQKTKGKISGTDGAANLLGVNRSTLLSKMKKLKIDHREFQRSS